MIKYAKISLEKMKNLTENFLGLRKEVRHGEGL